MHVRVNVTRYVEIHYVLDACMQITVVSACDRRAVSAITLVLRSDARAAEPVHVLNQCVPLKLLQHQEWDDALKQTAEAMESQTPELVGVLPAVAREARVCDQPSPHQLTSPVGGCGVGRDGRSHSD